MNPFLHKLSALLLFLLSLAVCGESSLLTLLAPTNNAVISLQTPEQKEFAALPSLSTPHEISSKPRDTDGTMPMPVLFRWRASPGKEQTLLISETEDFTHCRAISVPVKSTIQASGNISPAPSTKLTLFPLYHLIPGTTYYWRVKSGEELSPVRTFTVARELPRWIHMPVVTNVRDLGGWKTRDGKQILWGKLFRGGQFEPWTMRPAGSRLLPDGEKTLLNELKIRTELDLRQDKPTRRILSAPGYHRTVLEIVAYEGMFQELTRRNMQKIFQLLSNQENYPVYFHCQGGGDRTGCLAFLLEILAGVSEEDAVLDYESSNLSVSGERSRFSPAWQAFRKGLASYGATLQEQVRGYLKSCGVTDDEMQAVVSILTTLRPSAADARP